MSNEALAALLRSLWKLVLVVVVTVALLVAIGWIVRAVRDGPGERTTTVEER
ncbi:MAG: hypothetical protein M3312_03845 [Actinomycetota bacterium]|nr:hypothetical protein [Actinomycetota bacterium]